MAAKTQMIHARIDPRLKKSAEAVFSKIGLSTAEAIRLFLTQVEIYRGLQQAGPGADRQPFGSFG